VSPLVRDALSWGATDVARIADSRDFSEGLESFFSKRPPAFEGR